jgi:anti-sigma factor RsiW
MKGGHQQYIEGRIAMACREFADRLIAWGELGADERERLDAHVMSCDACRQALEALQEVDAALSEKYTRIQAPRSLRDAVERRIHAQAPPRVSLLPSVLDWLAWSAMLAAAALVIHFCLPPNLLSGLSAWHPGDQLQQRLQLPFGDGRLSSGDHR